MTGLADKAAIGSVALEQCLEAGAAQRDLGGQHAGHSGSGPQGGRLDTRLDADERNGQLFADERDGLRRGRIAGHDERFGALLDEPLADGEGAVGDEIVVALPVRRVQRIGDVQQRLVLRLRPNRSQHRQAA